MSTQDLTAPDSQQSRAATLAVALAVALTLAYTWWRTDWHYRFGIPVPFRTFVVPVLWWALTVGYLAVVKWGLRLSERSGPVILDGAVLHIQWALVRCHAEVPIQALVGRPYAIYITLAMAFGMAFSAYRAGAAARALISRGEGTARSLIVYGTLVAAARLVMSDDRILCAALVVGAALGALSASGRLATAIAALARAADTALAHPRASLAVVACTAVALRVTWYRHIVGVVGFDLHTGFPAASDDGQTYHVMAMRIAETPRLLLETACRGANACTNPVARIDFDPLYPLLLGFWYWLTGVHFTPAAIIQCLLAVIPVVVAYAFAKRMAAEAPLAGLVAASIVALSTPLISFSVIQGIETLYIPVLSLWAWAAWRYSEGDSTKTLIWVGLAGGMMLGLRRFGLLFLIGLLPWLVWAARDRRMATRFGAWAAVVLLAVLVYLPVEVMYLRTDNGGRLTAPPAVASYWKQPSPDPEYVPGNEAFIELGLDPARPMESLAIAASHPPKALAAAWAVIPPRILSFFFWPAFGTFDSILLLNPNATNPLSPVLEFYLALAAVAGIVSAVWQRRSRSLAVLLLMVIGAQMFASAVIAITITSRYSAPIRPFLMAFAGAGAVVVIRRLVARDRSVA